MRCHSHYRRTPSVYCRRGVFRLRILTLTCSPQAPSVEMRVRQMETDHEEEQVHGRTDYFDFARAGGWLGDCRGLPAEWDQRADVLSLEGPIWRDDAL